MQLHQRWDRLLEQTPHRVLLIEASGQRWTVRSLDEISLSWSSQLEAVSGIAGRVIGFRLANGADWIGLFIAILRAGGVAMPLDPGGEATATDPLIRSFGGVAIIDGEGLRHWPASRRRLPAEICLVKLTSGSTGKPERFCFTHAEMDADGRQIECGMGLRADDINFAVIPFSHSYGLGNFVMPLLRSGTAVALGRSILPRELSADLKATSATVFPAVPPIIHALATADLPTNRLGQIRMMISAGGRLLGETARQFEERFELPVHGFYGSTETGGISFDATGSDTRTERSVGTPLPGVEITRSRTGRLLVASPATFSHANRRRMPTGTGRVLLPDFGCILDDGAIALSGRRRGFIKRAGRRVSLVEVEGVVRSIPRIRETWATVIRPGGAEERIGLAVETDLTIAEVRLLLIRRLPKIQRPARIICLKGFPTTVRGKIATAELEQMFG